MARKRVLTARLAANMIAAENVYTSDGQLLFPDMTVLTEEVIEALKDHSVFAVRIQVADDGKTPLLGDPSQSEKVRPADNLKVDFAPDYSAGREEKVNYYNAVRKTPEYKEFSQSFLNTVDRTKDMFNRVVMQNEKVDSDVILADVEEVVVKSRNSLHILDMLQCMRGFDDVTYVHSVNVALLSNMIGKIAFPDISKDEMDVLTIAALLHDIGKMMIPDEVLNKPDRLTISEFNIIKTHVLHGSNILKGMQLDPRVAEVALHHHERCDGSGYPDALKEGQIIPFARIVAIADAYDAMTSKRVYRNAICPFKVIDIFEHEGLAKYELNYLLPFLSMAAQAYINTEVRLSNNEIGRVVMLNSDELSRPVVKVGQNFYDLAKKRSITIEKLMDE